MQGLMMEMPLLISSLIDYAAAYHGDTEVVSRTHDHPLHRTTYRATRDRARQLANALTHLGVKRGDRIATLAWNDFRHLELYFGISGMGAICHTINPRLFPEQIVYIISHAEDRFVFVDPMFVPLLERLQPQLPDVRGYVVLSDPAHLPSTQLPNPLCYESLLAAEAADFVWPHFDENTASSLCYTSGTTGHPKGALYSHRSTVIHSFGISMADALALSSHEVILPVVPMFHANAWGLPYAAPMCGSKLVMPGPKLDGASVHQLLISEGVTMTAGVPTVWLMLLNHLRESGQNLGPVERVVVGGSAVPRAMLEAFEREYGVRVVHAWGMTETSPLGVAANLKREHRELAPEAQFQRKLKQGRGLYGVELRIVDDRGQPLPHDGKAFGELQVRGPWVIRSYFKEEKPALDAAGWFATGDVATIDPEGYMQITDRAKDVIKSGGEWISSIDLENQVMSHPAVAEAAVIGVAHPKWGERPLLLVVQRAGTEVSREDLLTHLAGRVAGFWLPDDVVVVPELPHTATGKVSKKTLREQYKDHVFSSRPSA